MMVTKYEVVDCQCGRVGNALEADPRGDYYLASDIDPRLKGLTWTKERPSVPGFYWFKPKNKHVRIVNVTPKTIDSIYGPGAEWSGPLTPPLEVNP